MGINWQQSLRKILTKWQSASNSLGLRSAAMARFDSSEGTTLHYTMKKIIIAALMAIAITCTASAKPTGLTYMDRAGKTHQVMVDNGKYYYLRMSKSASQRVHKVYLPAKWQRIMREVDNAKWED